MSNTPGTTASLSQFTTAEAERERDHRVALCEQYGFTPTLEEAYDITEIEMRSQVRSSDRLAPPDRVRMLSQQMKLGSPIAPGVVTADGTIIDGNTTVAAARKNGRTALPFFVLDMYHAEADNATLARLEALGCELNNHGPQPLAKADKLRVAADLLREDYSVERICQIVGLDASAVYSVKREVAGEAKLGKVGLVIEKPVLIRAFGRIATLHDEVFKALVSLAIDAGLGSGAIGDLGKRVRAANSDAAQLAVISAERDVPEVASAIEQMRTKGGAPRPPLARQMKQALGRIVKLGENEPDVLVERAGDLAREYLDILEESAAILQRIIPLQQELVTPKPVFVRGGRGRKKAA